MQIVIDIPEEKELIDKALWNDVSDFDKEDLVIVLNAIAHGTPLPKGHGDLVDRDDLLGILQCEEYETCTWMNCSDCNREKCIKRRDILDAPTIIEADAESEE